PSRGRDGPLAYASWRQLVLPVPVTRVRGVRRWPAVADERVQPERMAAPGLHRSDGDRLRGGRITVVAMDGATVAGAARFAAMASHQTRDHRRRIFIRRAGSPATAGLAGTDKPCEFGTRKRRP